MRLGSHCSIHRILVQFQRNFHLHIQKAPENHNYNPNIFNAGSIPTINQILRIATALSGDSAQVPSPQVTSPSSSHESNPITTCMLPNKFVSIEYEFVLRISIVVLTNKQIISSCSMSSKFSNSQLIFIWFPAMRPRCSPFKYHDFLESLFNC